MCKLIILFVKVELFMVCEHVKLNNTRKIGVWGVDQKRIILEFIVIQL